MVRTSQEHDSSFGPTERGGKVREQQVHCTVKQQTKRCAHARKTQRPKRVRAIARIFQVSGAWGFLVLSWDLTFCCPPVAGRMQQELCLSSPLIQMQLQTIEKRFCYRTTSSSTTLVDCNCFGELRRK